MKFEQFSSHLDQFMKENNIDESSDFRNLALYRIIKETSLSDLSSYKLMNNNVGGLELVQTSDYSHVRGISIQGGSVNCKGPDYETYVPVYSNLEKTMVLPFYQAILEKDNIDDIQEYILDSYYDSGNIDINNSSEIKDDFARNLGNFLITRISSQHLSNSDSSVIKSYLVENFLKVAIDNTRNSLPDSLLKRKSGDMILDIITGNKTKIDTRFLADGDCDGIHISQKSFDQNNDIVNFKHYEGTFAGALMKNINNKDTLVDNMFNEFALPRLKKIAAYKLRLFEKKPTIENKLDNSKLNMFFSNLRQHYPTIFFENETHSFRHNVRRDSDYDDVTSVSNIIDKFNISDTFHDAHLTVNFTDQYKVRQNKAYYIGNDQNVVRFIGETDMSVKYLISGRESVRDNNIKLLNIEHIMTIETNPEHNSLFLRIGFEELFKYCKQNDTVLLFNKSNLASALGDNFNIFCEVFSNYEKSIFMIEDNHRENKINLLHNTRLDIANIKKNEHKLLAAVEQGDLKKIEDELLNKQVIKQKI